MDAAALATLVLVGGIVVLLLIGAPVSIAVGLSATASLCTVLGVQNGVLTSAQQVFRGVNSFPLLAIPFFVLAGVVMNNGGIALRLVNAAKVLVGRTPGALAQTNIAANALFGAVSGSAVASAAAVGSTMAPLQAKEGYDRNFAAAVNIASAPAGMLIPPSNLVIVYSLVSSSSIAALFVAGYLPGVAWALVCMAIVFLVARRRPEMRFRGGIGIAAGVRVLLSAVPALLLIVIVIGGILAGFFTPTEASVIAVAYSLALAFAYRAVQVRHLPGILMEATRTTAVVMFLIGVSSIMGFVLSFAQIPAAVSETMFGLTTNPVLLLLLIAAVLLAVGCFMDPTPAVLIFTPIFLPIVTSFGIDPVHFGIIMVFNLCIGTITPPVGPVLFIGAKVADVSIESVFRSLLPFFGAIALMLVVVIFTPALSLWLPTALGLM
ncbi:TRAP transporter large permease [Kineococcus esterisolvens]|uniref:TRAP transporter large permease n=1 Tax=unclassified Kineococcus TaxID=2621656 RepID=UPI003D7E0603